MKALIAFNLAGMLFVSAVLFTHPDPQVGMVAGNMGLVASGLLFCAWVIASLFKVD